MSRTQQEMFDIVAVHLLTQNAKSYAEGGQDYGCAYRSIESTRKSNGRSCAIGCMIPDSEYDDELEGTALAVDDNGKIKQKVVDVLNAADIALYDVRFAMELQVIHDQHDPHLWPRRLVQFAIKHGLTQPELLKERAPSDVRLRR